MEDAKIGSEDCCAVPVVKNTAAAIEPSESNYSLLTSGGSIVAAFLASACCVGPLVFALLGLSGAGLLVAFEPYRPLFLTLTAALLGAGFYFTYRPRRTVATSGGTSGEACDCPAPRTNRAGRVMLWVATVLVVAFLATPYLIPFIVGCC